jgi:hypothetical protein
MEAISSLLLDLYRLDRRKDGTILGGKNMNLKTAREIARKVGATIEEKKELIHANEGVGAPAYYDTIYIVRLGVVKINSSGVRENIVLHASSPYEAADLAVVETGRAARALLEEAKSVYVGSGLVFGVPKS